MSEAMEKDPLLDVEGLEGEDTQKGKYLTFHLAGEIYGLEICHVTEIIGIQSITQVPDMPNFVKGVINLRGQVIPVMDMRLRFQLSPQEYDERTCVIVMDVDNKTMGLIVDRVEEVVDIPQNQIEPASVQIESQGQQFVKGLGKVHNEIRILLEAEKLIDT